jgi:acetylornithine deacetylase/succinyl-diaminopimelate desuccinylase-like protein
MPAPDLDDMLADLRLLVEVESPSRDVDALTRSAAVLADVIERRLGTPPRLVPSPAGPHVHWVGGGSDGNFTAAAGVPTLDGLGAVGGGAHADHEYVEVDTMVERAQLVAGLVAALTA